MLTQTGSAATAKVEIRAGACGQCTLCCKLMGVASISKPANVWCQHCKTDAGCGIYETRPGECANFVCGFLSMPVLPEEWRPMHSRLILNTQTTEGTMYVHVDPVRPDAWRRKPYLAVLQNWAAAALKTQGRVIVRIGTRSIVVMPDHAMDFGVIAQDEVIVVFSVQPGPGMAKTYQVYVAKADAWAKASAGVQQGTEVPALVDGFRAGRRLD